MAVRCSAINQTDNYSEFEVANHTSILHDEHISNSY